MAGLEGDKTSLSLISCKKLIVKVFSLSPGSGIKKLAIVYLSSSKVLKPTDFWVILPFLLLVGFTLSNNLSLPTSNFTTGAALLILTNAPVLNKFINSLLCVLDASSISNAYLVASKFLLGCVINIGSAGLSIALFLNLWRFFSILTTPFNFNTS